MGVRGAEGARGVGVEGQGAGVDVREGRGREKEARRAEDGVGDEGTGGEGEVGED